MELDIHTSWENIIKRESKKEYFKSLMIFVKFNYENKTCYPPIIQFLKL